MNIRRGELFFLAIGLTLFAISAGTRFHGSMASRAAIDRFQANTTAALDTDNSVPAVNLTLWSPTRVAVYKDSLAAKTDLPLAILRIPRINLYVPVFNDVDDLNLNSGEKPCANLPREAYGRTRSSSARSSKMLRSG
jgi:hypothetical protein